MRPSISNTIAVSGREPERADALKEDAPLRSRIDEAAFQALYQATAPTLRSYLKRISGDAALADDILQETFYRFLRTDLPAMEQFQMKAYLYRTANSLLADHWRRVKRERRWSLANFFGGEAAADAKPGGEVMSVFRGLKPQEQSLLWLAYVEGFDHREVALALELSEKSVRVLLFRARLKLAGLLKKQGFSGEEKS
jgi:RNA polymerase sigma-70 factor (ECF subfamily)